MRLLTGRACTCACVRARAGRQQGTQGSALRGKTLCMSTAVMPVAYNMACEAPCRHHTARAVRSTAQHGTARARAQMSANLQKDYSPSGSPRPAQDCLPRQSDARDGLCYCIHCARHSHPPPGGTGRRVQFVRLSSMYICVRGRVKRLACESSCVSRRECLLRPSPVAGVEDDKRRAPRAHAAIALKRFMPSYKKKNG